MERDQVLMRGEAALGRGSQGWGGMWAGRGDRAGLGRGRREEGKDAAAAPPPGPPRSRSCSGPPAAPPGSARQAPPARRRRGGGVDAVAYAFARERVQEGPGGRHLAVVPRGARGVAQAGHGAGGALGAAAVRAEHPAPRARPRPPRGPTRTRPLHAGRPRSPAPRPPQERGPLTFGNPSRSPEPVDRQTAVTRLRRAKPAPPTPSRTSPAAAPPPSAQPTGAPPGVPGRGPRSGVVGQCRRPGVPPV